MLTLCNMLGQYFTYGYANKVWLIWKTLKSPFRVKHTLWQNGFDQNVTLMKLRGMNWDELRSRSQKERKSEGKREMKTKKKEREEHTTDRKRFQQSNCSTLLTVCSLWGKWECSLWVCTCLCTFFFCTFKQACLCETATDGQIKRGTRVGLLLPLRGTKRWGNRTTGSNTPQSADILWETLSTHLKLVITKYGVVILFNFSLKNWLRTVFKYELLIPF